MCSPCCFVMPGCLHGREHNECSMRSRCRLSITVILDWAGWHQLGARVLPNSTSCIYWATIPPARLDQFVLAMASNRYEALPAKECTRAGSRRLGSMCRDRNSATWALIAKGSTTLSRRRNSGPCVIASRRLLGWMVGRCVRAHGCLSDLFMCPPASSSSQTASWPACRNGKAVPRRFIPSRRVFPVAIPMSQILVS